MKQNHDKIYIFETKQFWSQHHDRNNLKLKLKLLKSWLTCFSQHQPLSAILVSCNKTKTQPLRSRISQTAHPTPSNKLQIIILTNLVLILQNYFKSSLANLKVYFSWTPDQYQVSNWVESWFKRLYRLKILSRALKIIISNISFNISNSINRSSGVKHHSLISAFKQYYFYVHRTRLIFQKTFYNK